MKDNLKPCPFCGSKAKLVKRKGLCKWAIACTNEYCESSVWLPKDANLKELHCYLMCFKYKKDCIKAWNKRIKDEK